MAGKLVRVFEMEAATMVERGEGELLLTGRVFAFALDAACAREISTAYIGKDF